MGTSPKDALYHKMIYIHQRNEYQNHNKIPLTSTKMTRIKKSEKNDHKGAWWLSEINVQLLISTQVIILPVHGIEPRIRLCAVRLCAVSCLRFSLSTPPAHTQMLSIKINIKKKKTIKIIGMDVEKMESTLLVVT